MVKRLLGCVMFAMSVYYVTTGVTNATPLGLADNDSIQAEATLTKKQMRSRDRALARAVQRSIEKSLGIEAVGISIFTKDGVVTLVGRVRDPSSVQGAEDATSRTEGVVRISNQIIVRDGGR